MDKNEYDRLLSTDVVKDYKRMMIDGLKNSYPLLDVKELDDAILKSFGKCSVMKLFTHDDE